MHDEIDPLVTSFVEELRATYGDAPTPTPSESLATLFADGIVVAPRARRQSMVKHGLKAVPGKVAAGLVGLLIGYTGLGAAGALPGALTLASDDEQETVVTEDETTTTTLGDDEGGDELADEDGGEATVEDGDGEGDDPAPVNLADVPIPTSVSEAAHNHAFDEACGNHGRYVSHFARFGTEPECATSARQAASESDPEATATATAESEDDGDDNKDKNKGKDKGKAKKAKKAKRH